jgi:predicted transcriptional regulator
MYLLDAQKNGKDWVWFEDITKAMGVSGKCFREKANLLIDSRWITKGRRGYYSLNKFPTLF